MTLELHPQLAGLRGFLGTWRGHGRGHYPTIASFEYDEEVEFWHTGRAWIGYRQRTFLAEGGAPSHSEAGYLRPLDDGRIELVLAHAFGVTEIQEGRIDGGRIELRSTSLDSTATALRIDAVARTLRLDGDTIEYEVAMAFADQPLQNHLAGVIRRAG